MQKNHWQNTSALILDERSIVYLKILKTLDMGLSQAKDKTNNNTAVLSDLVLILIIENFYKKVVMDQF